MKIQTPFDSLFYELGEENIVGQYFLSPVLLPEFLIESCFAVFASQNV